MEGTTLRQKLAFFALFIPAIVGSGLAFGWDRAWIGAAVVGCGWVLGSILLASAAARRASRERGAGVEMDADLEHLDPATYIGQVVDLHFEGTRRRYRADFGTAASPVVSAMRRDERRVARALTLLGFPPAVVTAVKGPTEGDAAHAAIYLPEGLI